LSRRTRVSSSSVSVESGQAVNLDLALRGPVQTADQIQAASTFPEPEGPTIDTISPPAI